MCGDRLRAVRDPVVRSLEVGPGLRGLNVGVQPSDGSICLSAPVPNRAHMSL